MMPTRGERDDMIEACRPRVWVLQALIDLLKANAAAPAVPFEYPGGVKPLYLGAPEACSPPMPLCLPFLGLAIPDPPLRISAALHGAKTRVDITGQEALAAGSARGHCDPALFALRLALLRAEAL
jgi:hypothetical protein